MTPTTKLHHPFRCLRKGVASVTASSSNFVVACHSDVIMRRIAAERLVVRLDAPAPADDGFTFSAFPINWNCPAGDEVLTTGDILASISGLGLNRARMSSVFDDRGSRRGARACRQGRRRHPVQRGDRRRGRSRLRQSVRDRARRDRLKARRQHVLERPMPELDEGDEPGFPERMSCRNATHSVGGKRPAERRRHRVPIGASRPSQDDPRGSVQRRSWPPRALDLPDLLPPDRALPRKAAREGGGDDLGKLAHHRIVPFPAREQPLGGDVGRLRRGRAC